MLSSVRLPFFFALTGLLWGSSGGALLAQSEISNLETVPCQENTAAKVKVGSEPETRAITAISGPQVGERLPKLPVWVSMGKDKPTAQMDLAAQSQETPLTIAFMHERSRPAFQLVRAISQFAELRKEAKLRFFAVVLTDDRSSSEQWLGQIGGYFKEPTQLAVAEGGIEGPGALGLNRLMDMTILVVKDGTVTANFALTQVSAASDGPDILQAINKVSGGGDVPDIENLLPQPGQPRNQRQR